MKMNSKVKQLVSESEGLHLSLYIPLDGVANPFEVCVAAIELAKSRVSFLTESETKRFFEPISELLSHRVPTSLDCKGIVVLRSRNLLEVSRLDFACAPLCIVAKSFHIKPVIMAMQSDFAFGLIHFNKDGAQVYRVERNELHLLGRERLHKTESTSDYEVNAANRIFTDRIDKLIAKSTRLESLEIRLSGSSKPMWGFLKHTRNRHINSEWLCEGNAFRNVRQAIEMTRALSEFKRLNEHEKEVNDGLSAFENGLTRNNIFQVAQDAALGKVEKLFVSLDNRLWGSVDERTGSLSLNDNFITEHADDILDDLSELVLKKGGEVIVLDKSQMPKHLLAFSVSRRDFVNRASCFAS